MYKNKRDKTVIGTALQNDVFYYKILHLSALFIENEVQKQAKENEKLASAEKKSVKVGKPPLDWRLAEKIFRAKGNNAASVAKNYNVSTAKVYKVWQGLQPAHEAYKMATNKEPLEDAEAFVEWIKKEGL